VGKNKNAKCTVGILMQYQPVLQHRLIIVAASLIKALI